jgi:DNA mismatch repair ATPase MutS
MDSKSAFFESRINIYHSRYLNLRAKLRSLAFLRVVTFITYLVVLLISANYSNLTGVILSTLLFILIFVLLVKLYNNTQFLANHKKFLSKINSDELLRNKGTLDGFDPGLEFASTEHPYHNDLDIFGKNSLFQLINRCTTFWGRITLAKWLSYKADPEEILLRQEGIKELSENIDWLQEFQATGLHNENISDISKFQEWLKSDQTISNIAFYNIIRFLGPLIMIVILCLVILSVITYHWIFLGIVINSLILLSVFDRVKHIHENTNEAIKSLKSLEALIILVEKGNFNSAKLGEIQSIYLENTPKVSLRISSLNRILQNLDNRSNQIYHLFNLLFLLDLHYAIQAEHWKMKQPDNIKTWFEAMGEFESLASFAGMAFANPGYVFPEILKGEHILYAENMGHPLIPAKSRVANNFSLNGLGSIGMITGSNMAGKSTFLRTVGVNMVLAQAGGPVCAEKFGLTISQVFSSMRTQDNLEENISSFYAELNRIKKLLEITSDESPVFFLLDEILKGTNSHDRHLGAVSLVHQLMEENTSGLISTHDIDLAKEATEGRKVSNFSFNSIINGDEIIFDYKLTPGICESFNASKLMKKMGIRIKEE